MHVRREAASSANAPIGNAKTLLCCLLPVVNSLQDVFKSVERLCAEEGIDCAKFMYRDNTTILETLEGSRCEIIGFYYMFLSVWCTRSTFVTAPKNVWRFVMDKKDLKSPRRFEWVAGRIILTHCQAVCTQTIATGGMSSVHGSRLGMLRTLDCGFGLVRVTGRYCSRS